MHSYIRNLKAIVLLMPFVFMACVDNDTDVPVTQSTVNVQIPNDVNSLDIVRDSLVYTNLTTGEKLVTPRGVTTSLPQGIYDCAYGADVTYKNGNDSDAVIAKGRLTGKVENIEFTGQSKSVSMETFLSTVNDDFIFEEIFFTGTLRASGSQYYGDSYIKIYNNTDHVLYADGLAFCESKFKSTLLFDYHPDIRRDTFTVWSCYVIPGSGTDHPVQPGHSMLIVDTGIDHRVANPNSLDFSAADFEWYDVSIQPAHMDIDSPTVPNLDKWYCYTESFYVLHNRGFTSFVLARIPKGMTKEEWLKDYHYWYDYIQSTTVGDFYMTQEAYKIPNSWIVDGVNCSVEAKRLWNILPPSIDAGWTHCGTVDHDKTRYFKSVRRKLEYLNDDGTMHLKDTNNSTEDFNTECVPSEIEIQHSATNAQGDKCTQMTYDGVVPKSQK